MILEITEKSQVSQIHVGGNDIYSLIIYSQECTNDEVALINHTNRLAFRQWPY